jgi:hypothetical protein
MTNYKYLLVGISTRVLVQYLHRGIPTRYRRCYLETHNDDPNMSLDDPFSQAGENWLARFSAPLDAACSCWIRTYILHIHIRTIKHIRVQHCFTPSIIYRYVCIFHLCMHASFIHPIKKENMASVPAMRWRNKYGT